MRKKAAYDLVNQEHHVVEVPQLGKRIHMVQGRSRHETAPEFLGSKQAIQDWHASVARRSRHLRGPARGIRQRMGIATMTPRQLDP